MKKESACSVELDFRGMGSKSWWRICSVRSALIPCLSFCVSGRKSSKLSTCSFLATLYYCTTGLESVFELQKLELYKNAAELFNGCQLNSESWNNRLMRQRNKMALKMLFNLLVTIFPPHLQWKRRSIEMTFCLQRSEFRGAKRTDFPFACPTPTTQQVRNSWRPMPQPLRSPTMVPIRPQL